jgi:hypothetical protein
MAERLCTCFWQCVQKRDAPSPVILSHDAEHGLATRTWARGIRVAGIANLRHELTRVPWESSGGKAAQTALRSSGPA